jgi:hypothetical protein
MWIRSLCYIAQIVTDGEVLEGGELSARHRWFEVGDGEVIDRLM